MSRYLISGISGQDGQIAAILLNKKGHYVAGITHVENSKEVAGCDQLWQWDWSDETAFQSIIEEFKPDYFLNFATCHISSAGDEKDLALHREMLAVNLIGLAIMLRAVLQINPATIFIHASSSQIYTANGLGEIVDELSAKIPNTFYGYTKFSGMNLVDYYRRQYGMNGGSAILFNHESHFRGMNFVTRIISKAVAEIKLGKSNMLNLRNIGAEADMSSAYDIVQGVMLMCEKNNNFDYILSSFKTTSIVDLVKFGFEYVNLDWNDFVRYEKNQQSNYVIGDNTLSKNELDWRPEINMRQVIESMVEYDLKLIQDDTARRF